MYQRRHLNLGHRLQLLRHRAVFLKHQTDFSRWSTMLLTWSPSPYRHSLIPTVFSTTCKKESSCMVRRIKCTTTMCMRMLWEAVKGMRCTYSSTSRNTDKDDSGKCGSNEPPKFLHWRHRQSPNFIYCGTFEGQQIQNDCCFVINRTAGCEFHPGENSYCVHTCNSCSWACRKPWSLECTNQNWRNEQQRWRDG